MTRWALMAIVALAGCGGGGGGGASPLPPGGIITTVGDQSALPSSGQTWIYDQSIITAPPPYGGTSGQLTITFQGTDTYRGDNEPAFTAIGVAGPPILTTHYVRSGDGSLAEHAGAFYNFTVYPPSCSSPQQEEVLDVPRSFSAPTAPTSLTETSYRCGFAPAVSADTLHVTDGGAQALVLPSGTFSVSVRSGAYTVFGTRETYTDYVAGMSVLERDASFFDASGNLTAQTKVSYRSGPLNVAFPGPPMLLSQYY
jgi:hypothetical protein